MTTIYSGCDSDETSGGAGHGRATGGYLPRSYPHFIVQNCDLGPTLGCVHKYNTCNLLLLGTALALLLVACTVTADDYDDEGYGSQGGGNGNSAGGGGSNQANDNDNYQNGYDDGYSAGNMPNHYQQNVDSDSSNSNPSSSNYSPQGGSDADGDYEGDDGSAAAAASAPEATVVRVRRSTTEAAAAGGLAGANSGSSSGADVLSAEESAPKLRVKRGGKYYIGPVYTYVKTDKHANFKWGVKHKVGKKHYG